MELNYDETLTEFYKYIDNCRKRIKEYFFSEEDLETGYHIKSNLIKSNKIDENTSVSEAIKIHRNSMIDVKLNHTMRVVNDVARMSNKIGVNIDFEKILRISALLHDIGRFEQAVNNNDYIDIKCKMFNGSNHAEYGYRMLYINKDIEKFLIPKKYHFVISEPVRYHQLPTLTGDLAIPFKNPNELNISYITGKEDLNDQEKIIVAALVQMVKDVDMLDILYQHLTGEYPVVRQSICYKVCGDSLETISKHFDIPTSEIMEYNGLNSDNIDNRATINVPVANMNPNKLIVPLDIQERFFNNEHIELKELQNRRDWTFITGMWWRLNQFLNNINFVSNLELVKEHELLEKIYEMYPESYKPLVKDAFEFAKQELIDKAIENNKGQIYKSK